MARPLPRCESSAAPLRVLVIGAYLAQRKNSIEHLVRRYTETRACRVTQSWAAINGSAPSEQVSRVTAEEVTGYVPKFALMNRLLKRHDLREFDYVLVSDDDIVVQDGFLDAFLLTQRKYDLALAQPARTRNSVDSKSITVQRQGVNGRLTQFVEIGPVFSIRADLFAHLLPFDESSPMGWGLDLVWPTIVHKAGLRMGIVDCAPVDHSLRRLSSTYDGDRARLEMEEYLSKRDHIPMKDIGVELERF